MRFKILSLFAAVVLLAACAQDAQQDSGSSGSGTAATASTPKTTAAPKKKVASKPAPGSKEEFVVDVGDRVFFGVDISDLNLEAQATLDGQAAWLKKYPSVRVTIEGHCDERGTREYNLALGERRASAVRDYLVARGIDPSRLSTISYGKERPVAFASNEGDWEQNRRGVTSVN